MTSNPIDPDGPFAHWPPADPPTEDDLPDRFSCLMTIVSWLIILILLSVLMSLSSCRATQTIVELRDSIRTEVRTETVYVPDTVPVFLPDQSVTALTPDTASHLETDVAVSDAVLINGLLRHTLTNKRTPIPVPVQHRETTRDSIVVREREVPVPVPVVREVAKPLTVWQQARLHFANIMLIVLAIAAAIWGFRKRTWWLRLFTNVKNANAS